jgi:hypothetical protein
MKDVLHGLVFLILGTSVIGVGLHTGGFDAGAATFVSAGVLFTACGVIVFSTPKSK